MGAAIAKLTADWRKQADDMERSAKAYNRACVKHKGVQLILAARQLRDCANQVDQINEADASAPQA